MLTLKITVNQKIVKKHYIKEINDFWIDMSLSSYGEKVYNILKNNLFDMLTKEENERTITIDDIAYTLNISLSNGHHNQSTFSEKKLPENLAREMDKIKMESFILYHHFF